MTSTQASKKTDFTVDLIWWGLLKLAKIIDQVVWLPACHMQRGMKCVTIFSTILCGSHRISLVLAISLLVQRGNKYFQ